MPNTKGGLLVRRLGERETILDLGKGKNCCRDFPPGTTNVGEKGKLHARNILYKYGPDGRIYYMESSRSLNERSKEHMNDAASFHNMSHIVKHWMLLHPEEMTPPPFSVQRLPVKQDYWALRI